MTKKEKAKFIIHILNSLFPDPPIPLKHKDLYTLLISVLLSARSTDAMVNKVTPDLFARADKPEKMITLSVEEIRELIRKVGLSPTKAKNIWHLSEILVKKYKGKVPKTWKALESLPGVGHKTASVVMAQGYNKPAFPVDTHIQRCAKRWGLSHAKTPHEAEKDLKKLFPKKMWIKLHLQIIYFARAYCPSRNHKKKHCPICEILD